MGKNYLMNATRNTTTQLLINVTGFYGDKTTMTQDWEKNLACAIACSRCEGKLDSGAERILSVYDHQPICLICKKEEETRPDYEEASKNMIGQCLTETETMYGDPGGYCYYHFYPFKC
jgi:hypothetical protein